MSSSGRRKGPRVMMGPRVDSGSSTVCGDVGGVSASGSDAEGAKRRKPGSPLVDGALAGVIGGVPVVAAPPDGVSESSSGDVGDVRGNRRKKKIANRRAVGAPAGVKAPGGLDMGELAATAGGANGRMRSITRRMNGVLFSAALPNADKERLMDFALEYNELVVALIAANERLSGELCALRSSGVAVCGASVQAPAKVPAAAVSSGAVSRAGVPAGGVPPAPPQTWAVVVKAKDGAASEKVVAKVRDEVAPTLGVRVHEVRRTKEGAVIRTPSKAERQRIVDNRKFGEVGLEVSVMDRLGPKIVVRDVQKTVSTDEFMEAVYEMNLKDMMARDRFLKSVRLVTGPWEKGLGSLNVTLECTPRVAQHLSNTGVYVTWNRFLVRVLDPVATCHRCCGFGHMARMCRMKEDVCRTCGQTGHVAARCVNPAHCRNCAARGRPADHSMVSFGCPEYVAMVARAEARH